MRVLLMSLLMVPLAVGCGGGKTGGGDLLDECLSVCCDLNTYLVRCGYEPFDDDCNDTCSAFIEDAKNTDCMAELREYVECVGALDFATAECPESYSDIPLFTCNLQENALSACSSTGSDCKDTGLGNCDTGVEADADADADVDADADADAGNDATFSVTWTGSSIDAAVTNHHADGYYLGLAETGAGAYGWYGEDAIAGDALHDLLDILSLDCVSTIAEVVSNSTTLLCSDESTTTYAFFGNENGDDWGSVSFCGGDDCSYYE